MSITAKLDAAIKAVCPIDGVSIGRKNDKATWRIDFKDEATASERTAAQSAVNAFDPVVADLPVDQDDLENLEKSMKATLLCVAEVGGLTRPQIRQMFRQKRQSLP